MILVTGGTGMLGSYLLVQLTQKYEKIYAVKRSTSSTQLTEKIFHYYLPEASIYLDKIQWIELNLLNELDLDDALQNIDEIYHCAAHISYQKKDKEQMIRNNQLITRNLVNASLRQKISKFCFVSSIAALGDSIDNVAVNEQTIWSDTGKNSAYSISKYLSEMEVWRGIAEGLNAVIINPSIILGIGNWQSGSSQIFNTIYQGLKFYTLGTTGFVDAKDVAKIMIQLMQCTDCFQQSYIVNAENIKYKDIFHKIAKYLSVKPASIYAKPVLSEIAWRWEFVKSLITGKSPLITKQSAQIAHKNLRYSSNKLQKKLDYQYRTIDDSLEEYATIFLKEREK